MANDISGTELIEIGEIVVGLSGLMIEGVKAESIRLGAIPVYEIHGEGLLGYIIPIAGNQFMFTQEKPTEDG